MSKDMARLKVGEKREGEGKCDAAEGGGAPGPGPSGSRRKELRRMSSKRRSSKQGESVEMILLSELFFFPGFLHFLDLAIAN